MSKKCLSGEKKAKAPNLKKECHALWSEIVKLKAGYKSEISGKEGKQIGGSNILHAHHIVGKPNYRLRYEINNGICLTSGEHKYQAHVEGRKKEFAEKVKAVRGKDIYDKLNMLKWTPCGGTQLMMVKEYLKQELFLLRQHNTLKTKDLQRQ